MKYSVEIRQINKFLYDAEADSMKEAEEKAMQQYNKEFDEETLEYDDSDIETQAREQRNQ